MSNIIRVEKNNNYVVMNRTALNDERLSWKAKGIIAYMLSMPDDWVFYVEELVTHSTDGERAFRAGFKELQEAGYVVRKPIREGQRIKNWETIVYEVPQDNSLLCGSVHVENEDVQNLHVQNEDVQSVHVQNSGLLSTDFDQVLKTPSTEEREKEQETPPSPVIDKNFQTLQTFFDEHIGKRNFTTDQELSGLLDDFKDPLLIGEALKIAAKNGKPLFTYGAGVLRKLAEEKGVTTHEQFKQRAEQKKQAPNLADRAKNKPTEFGGHILPF